jgi:hypothetical protein
MPTAATTSAPPSSNSGTGGTASDMSDTQSGGAVVPFIRGSGLHREAVYDGVWTPGANVQNIPQIDINAYGYARAIVIRVDGVVGVATGATLVEDGPFCALTNVQLLQPNGFPFYQVSSGYSSYLIHKYGGYRGYNEPKNWNKYAYTTGAGTAPNLAFFVRVPIELNVRDALGSLPNKNAAAPFKLSMSVNSLANIFGSTTFPTPPQLRIRVYLEAWDQPPAELDGQPVQTTPPAMNTIQYWTEQPITVPAGQFNARSTRMGNYLRMVIPVLRRASGTRANGQADWPDPLTIMIDQRNQDYVAKDMWMSDIYEKWGYFGTAEAANAPDNAALPYDWAHEFDGQVGNENRDLWLPTIEATRFELSGVWGNAGVITYLTNDVAPQGNVFV